MIKKRVSVSIVTGFLGAGKTSLLNHIIVSNPDKKIVVIENEFGEVNIDKQILAKGSDVYELSNGCICCNLSNELGLTLNRLILSGLDFDHLLIETTGIADPGEVSAVFLSGERVQRYFELDIVICLTDAMHFYSYLDERSEVRKQIASADRIVVNKIDEVEASVVDKIEKSVQSINPFAELVRTNFAKAPVNLILNQFAYRSRKKDFPIQPHLFQVDLNSESLSVLTNDNENRHGLNSIAIELRGDLDPVRFEIWLQNFLKFNKENIYRVKGVLSVAGENEKILLQAVKESVIVEALENWTGSDERKTQLVFIAENISKEQIQNSMESLLM